MPNESRIDQLREEAWAKGVVTDRGVDVAGGPIPRKPGYYGEPVVRPPVWTWEIPIYFFVGGLGGMSAVIALGALLFHHFDVARTAMWIAAIASVLSPILLILDLGRPHLFLHMLRVFKLQSAMSMGAWILAAFGMCVVPGLIAPELQTLDLFPGVIDEILGVAAGILVFGSAIFGTLLATYTGVLIGATAIPSWFLHHRLTTLMLFFATLIALQGRAEEERQVVSVAWDYASAGGVDAQLDGLERGHPLVAVEDGVAGDVFDALHHRRQHFADEAYPVLQGPTVLVGPVVRSVATPSCAVASTARPAPSRSTP